MLPLSAVREWTNPYYSFSLLRLTDSETHTYYHTHTHIEDTHRSRFACWWCRALPIFFFIIIFFFISLISSEVLIVSSWVSVSFPSPLQMSLVLVKVTRAIGLMGCFEKKGEPGWLGFLFVMCWIFSGGLVSILSSFLTKYQYNVNKNHPYNKYKWNYHLTVNIWELPPMEYIAKKKDDFFMSLFLYFHRLIKLCLYQKVRTIQFTFVINFLKIRPRIYTGINYCCRHEYDRSHCIHSRRGRGLTK